MIILQIIGADYEQLVRKIHYLNRFDDNPRKLRKEVDGEALHGPATALHSGGLS